MHHQNFKGIIACMIFLQLLSTASIAQQLNYKEYEFPKVEFKALQLNENLNLGNNSTPDDKGTRFSNSLYLSGSRYENSGNMQHYGNINISSFINAQKASSSFNTSGYSDNSFRKYNSKNQFFEYGYSANVNSNIRSKVNDYNILGGGLSIPLKVGIGRINILNEVMLAEFIVEDLKRDGLLTDSLNQAMIFAFAGEIAKYNFTRILDSRNYRLQVLKSLSFWLRDNFPLKENSEIELSSILIDNYSFAITGFRSIGSRLAVGIIPAASYLGYFKNDQYSLSYGGSLLLEYSIQKPLSRYLQSNFYTIVTLDLNRSENNYGNLGSSLDYNSIGPRALVGYKLGYYPNSRANVELTTLINYVFYSKKYDNDLISATESSNITPKLILQSSYFMNYRLRLFANFEVLYYHSFLDKDLNIPGNDYVPDDYSYGISNWYIGRAFDPSLADRNSYNTRKHQDKISNFFNAGFVFNIY